MVTKIEVLGYHRLSETDRHHFEEFFAACHVFAVTDSVVARAIELRQRRKMALGDALIAATALESGRELLTHNSKDYEGIAGLVVIDPIAGITSLNMRTICLVISVMLGMGLQNSPNHEHHGDYNGHVKREAEVGQGFGDDPG